MNMLQLVADGGAASFTSATSPRSFAETDPLIGYEPTSWQDFANCQGVDTDLFFPDRGSGTDQAKKVCAGCVVRTECLDYALDHSIKFGVWGGLSEKQRRLLRRDRHRNVS